VTESLALDESTSATAVALELEITAEGIETPGQLMLLREPGCDIGQGYCLSRPLPPDQLSGLFQAATLQARAA
jgi:EAL domain-containing protein (putative c-di-GMP-specific phosphodiesterase class I)